MQLSPACASMAEFTTPKKSKMSDAWEKATSSKKAPRKKASPDIPSQVRKSLTDNFKDMNPAEVDCVLRDGLTLRQKLEEDKRKNAECPGSVSFGKLYYIQLRTLYSSSEKVEQKLVPDKSLAVRPEVLDAAAQALKHPPQRAPLVQLLSRVTELSQPELVGVLRWCLQLHPSSSADQLKSAKAVMACVSRLGLEKKFPNEISLMKDKFDEILVQAACSCKT